MNEEGLRMQFGPEEGTLLEDVSDKELKRLCRSDTGYVRSYAHCEVLDRVRVSRDLAPYHVKAHNEAEPKKVTSIDQFTGDPESFESWARSWVNALNSRVSKLESRSEPIGS